MSSFAYSESFMMVNDRIHIHVQNDEQNVKFKNENSSWVNTSLKSQIIL